MTDGLSRLHKLIVGGYDLEELRTLCFHLGVRFDDLDGEGVSAKARELLLRMGRRRQLDRLLDALRRSRLELFDQASLDTSPAAVEALYATLPAFEADAAPPHQWAVVQFCILRKFCLPWRG